MKCRKEYSKEMEKVENIRDGLKNLLTPRRFNHSVNVMEKCVELARKYGVDEEKAALVGIAHDVAKEMEVSDMFKYIGENAIKIDYVERTHPALLHAKIGADISSKKYGFSKDMAEAISAHTTGKANMDNLAKILYVSDAISKERQEYYVAKAREIADRDLDEAVIFLLEIFVQDCKQKRKKVHPDSISALESLKRVKK